MNRLFVALLWLAHWLPMPVLVPVGRGFGRLLRVVARRRRHIVDVNLALCFPELDEAARQRLAREHFAMLGRSFLERGIQWWGSAARIESLVRVEGVEPVKRMLEAGEHVILLVPHFLALDVGGAGVGLHLNTVATYKRQSSDVIDRWLRYGRARFGDQVLLPTDAGLRRVIREIRSGRPFYYLPDMDYGRRESIFVPFFGVPAATIAGLPRLAGTVPAKVVPVVMRMLPGAQGYAVRFEPAWADFPGEDTEADVTRMNAWIESVVRTMPEQYYWVHRRFKTRPEGEPRPY